MPLSAAFFNCIMPLQIGARDVAFPRMNTLSLWCFIAGGITLNLSWFFTGDSRYRFVWVFTIDRQSIC